VIGGWIAIVVIDRIVATQVPAFSLLPALLSWLVNLVMFCVLYFWPSSDA
jgi:hypothetical protein